MTEKATHAAPVAPPKSGSPIRLLVLLGVLAIVVSAFAYDYFVAGPQSEKAYENIQKMVDTKNEKGVREGGLVKSADVREVVGFEPTYVQKERDYTVEWYCWWGKIPVLTTWKRYITVVYIGNNFNTHHKNEPPAAESLPDYLENIPHAPSDKSKGPPPNLPSVPMSTSAGEGGSGEGGKGKGGKGKGGKGKAPQTEAAPSETPAEPSSTDTPKEGDKPAEASKSEDAPKSEDKPAEDKPAEGKPAEAPKAEDKPADAPKDGQ